MLQVNNATVFTISELFKDNQKRWGSGKGFSKGLLKIHLHVFYILHCCQTLAPT